MCTNEPFKTFTIGNAQLSCTLSSLGASLADLRVMNREGRTVRPLLSVKALYAGTEDPTLTGRTIAPCCGRIRKGEMRLGDTLFPLECNEGDNHIHGGTQSAARLLWTGEQHSDREVIFRLTLPDGLCGYPGNRTLEAVYTVQGQTLQVQYRAVTDHTTYIDVTNHAYWDLSGRFDGSAMAQTLHVHASRYVRNDSAHLPLEILPVEGTPFDFRTPVSPLMQTQRYPTHEQLLNARGYNNALLFDATPLLTLRAPDDSLRMTMETNAPSVVFYSGGYLDASVQLANGQPACPSCALAFEAQDVPDSFHLPGAAPRILLPGKVFTRMIRWCFECGDDVSILP